MIISKSGPVLGLIEVQGGKELFAQVCAPKKAHGPLEHSGKLREAGGQFSQKLPKLVCFSTHLPAYTGLSACVNFLKPLSSTTENG